MQKLFWISWVLGLSGSVVPGQGPRLEFSEAQDAGYPEIVVCIFARNKAHTLPYFLGQFEELDYPKNRMHLFIRTDHNSDNSAKILEFWVEHVRSLYGSVDFEMPLDMTPGSSGFQGEMGPFHWTEERFRHLIELKEEAFYKARKMQVPYILFLDCDQFLTHTKTLHHLMWADKAIIAPVMRGVQSNYSNFWAGMTADGYYKRTGDYIPILYGENRGVFSVPMVHSVVLVNLRAGGSNSLTFDPKKVPGYQGPADDLVVFARSARAAGLQMHVTNQVNFGTLLEPSPEDGALEVDIENMRFLLLESQFNGPPGLLHSPFCPPAFPESSKLGFDEVYLINLVRRSERRKRMEKCFEILGIDSVHWPGTDGSLLTEKSLEEMGITMLPEFADPYHKRPLTMGEVGCFLSHYRIWQEMVEKGLKRVLVFEDDLRFIKYFRNLLAAILDDSAEIGLDWDLIYLGRKRLNPDRDGAEPVEGARYLTTVSYSYWTLAYALTLEGARKLLAAEPLKKLVPVDEYIPIMFDQHPETKWKSYFPLRNLRAFTAEPLLVYPTHYTGDHGYISDTENTIVIPDAPESQNANLGMGENQEKRGAMGSLVLGKDEL